MQQKRQWMLKDIFYFWGMVLAGSLLYAVSVNCFTAPNQIAPGGAAGIATMLHDLIGTPIGLTVLGINLPLFIWGKFCKGTRFLLKTIAATVISSTFIDLIALYLPPYRGDTLLAALFGGLLSGIGLGLVFSVGATTGGSDLAAKLLHRKLSRFSLGRIILMLDFIVVLSSVFVYRQIESGLYALITIFVTSRTVDAIICGVDLGTGKVFLVMSNQNKTIASKILTELGRGVTLLSSKGGYSGKEGQVLLCAVRRNEVVRLREMILKTDPSAFVVIANAEQIVGERFASLEEK